MKKTILSSMIILLCVALESFGQNVQTIENWKAGTYEYYLPKKLLVIKATYTLTKTTVLRTQKVKKDDEMVIVYDQKGQPVKLVDVSYGAVIKDPIQVTELVVADDKPYYLDFSKLSSGGKGYKLSFNANSQGILQGVNAEQTPVAAEIIGGVMGFVTKVVSVAAQGISAGIFGVASGSYVPSKDDEVQNVSQTVEVTKLIQFTDNTGEVKLDPQFGSEFTKVPKITVTYTALDKLPADMEAGPTSSLSKDAQNLSASTKATQPVADNTNNSSGGLKATEDKKGESSKSAARMLPVDGIVYRRSIPFQVQVQVENNEFVTKSTVLTSVVDVPQRGVLSSVPIPMAKGKKTSAVAFDISTGRVTKFENNKESGAAATFAKINSSTEELGKAIVEFRKAQEEQAKDKSIEEEIERLTLQNKLLENQLLNEQKKKALEEERNGSH
jgi:hypothetical protein